MAFGRIPRFSPSFSPREALVSARYLLRDGPDDEIVGRWEEEFLSLIHI